MRIVINTLPGQQRLSAIHSQHSPLITKGLQSVQIVIPIRIMGIKEVVQAAMGINIKKDTRIHSVSTVIPQAKNNR
ncbi:MAG TPA: hypothetical protein DDX84_12670 [Nitrospiraceae bacterium]|nr:hypothetical protein [Nitrospiraceae bacterium]